MECVTDKIRFPEGLRWRDGSLWFSDVLSDSVLRWGPGREPEVVFSGINGPSGLALLGDRVWVVSILDEALYELSPSGDHRRVLDLRAVGAIGPNDATLDGGAVYIGFMGRDYEIGDELRHWEEGPGGILRVDLTSDESHVVASGLSAPNGMVLTSDRQGLIVAETYGRRLARFDRHEDGSLSDRRVLATFGDGIPDGLAIDADDGVWVGIPNQERFVRVDREGVLTDELPIPGWSTVACALGGPDGRTLYLALNQMDDMSAFFEKRARGQILSDSVTVGALRGD
jgi:sugar lactone lactonase YvrE